MEWKISLGGMAEASRRDGYFFVGIQYEQANTDR